jgi:hypothetical protein
MAIPSFYQPILTISWQVNGNTVFLSANPDNILATVWQYRHSVNQYGRNPSKCMAIPSFYQKYWQYPSRCMAIPSFYQPILTISSQPYGITIILSANTDNILVTVLQYRHYISQYLQCRSNCLPVPSFYQPILTISLQLFGYTVILSTNTDNIVAAVWQYRHSISQYWQYPSNCMAVPSFYQPILIIT